MRHLIYSLCLLFLLASCKTSYKSTKMVDYDKQIEDNITIHIAFISSNDKDKLFASMNENLSRIFEEKGVKADISVTKVATLMKSIEVDEDNLRAWGPNGLILVIQESELVMYNHTKGKETSVVTAKLIDRHINKVVWKTEFQMVYKNVAGGLNDAGKFYANFIVSTLEKDKLLKK